jgi:hypothetical protein
MPEGRGVLKKAGWKPQDLTLFISRVPFHLLARQAEARCSPAMLQGLTDGSPAQPALSPVVFVSGPISPARFDIGVQPGEGGDSSNTYFRQYEGRPSPCAPKPSQYR